MNKAQFLNALKKTPRTWRVNDADDTIRRGEYEDFCPITAVIVAKKQECVDVGDAPSAAEVELKMKLDLANLIVAAADNEEVDELDYEYDEKRVAARRAEIKAMRAELLKACGIKKKGKG